MRKCPDCGKVLGAKFPLFKKDGFGNRVFLWKNLFKMDSRDIIFLFIVLLLIVGYVVDTSTCRSFERDPCGFVEDYDFAELCDNGSFNFFYVEPNVNVSVGGVD